MNKIPSKCYYEKLTGNILVITSELEDIVECTNMEQDVLLYPQLQNKNTEDIDFIELEYGSVAILFNKVKSYSINLETKSLDVVCFTQEELDIAKDKQDEQNINSRVSDITQYLSSSSETTIADIENSILEIEKNKIINGGM